ncbi:MAG: CBS domain-containing protein [Planctomycetota bacterium]|jgi:CBS domain-containing protein
MAVASKSAKKHENDKILSPIVKLSDKAFDAYCLNLSGLFNIEVMNKRHDIAFFDIKQLKKQFKKLTAVHSFKSDGDLKGNFYTIFDTDTLFALAGIVLQLSEDHIQDKIKNGTAKEADDIYDAVAEAANLLIASWDNIFHEQLENHHGLTRTDTTIGNSLTRIAKDLAQANDEQILLVTYHLMIRDLPEFKCFVLFTKSFIENNKAADSTENKTVEDQQKETPQETSQDNAETPAEETDKEEKETAPQLEDEKSAETKAEQSEPESKDNQQAETKEQQLQEQPEPSAEQSETAPDGEVSKAIQQMVNTTDENTDIAPEALIDISKSFPTSNLTAKDIMQTNIVWAEPEESVQQIQLKMQQNETAYVLVGNDNVLDGIVAMSDVRDAISPYLKSTFSKWRRPLDDATLQIRAKWVMTRVIHTIKPDTPLTEILIQMIQMCNFNIRSLPVINQDNHVQGIITVFDIFKAMIKTSNLDVAGKAVTTPQQN